MLLLTLLLLHLQSRPSSSYVAANKDNTVSSRVLCCERSEYVAPIAVFGGIIVLFSLMGRSFASNVALLLQKIYYFVNVVEGLFLFFFCFTIQRRTFLPFYKQTNSIFTSRLH